WQTPDAPIFTRTSPARGASSSSSWISSGSFSPTHTAALGIALPPGVEVAGTDRHLRTRGTRRANAPPISSASFSARGVLVPRKCAGHFLRSCVLATTEPWLDDLHDDDSTGSSPPTGQVRGPRARRPSPRS